MFSGQNPSHSIRLGLNFHLDPSKLLNVHIKNVFFLLIFQSNPVFARFTIKHPVDLDVHIQNLDVLISCLDILSIDFGGD